MEGDRKITFFHWKASQQHKKNTIAKITDTNVVTHEGLAGIELTVLNYFHSIYTSNNSDLVWQESMTDRTLGMDEISSLEKPFTVDEVFLALKQIKGRKVYGPDGLQACFLHKHWHILGEKVTSMTLDISNNREDISAFNDTDITLVPKLRLPIWLKTTGLLVFVTPGISLFLRPLSIGLNLLCLLLFMIARVLLLKRDL